MRLPLPEKLSIEDVRKCLELLDKIEYLYYAWIIDQAADHATVLAYKRGYILLKAMLELIDKRYEQTKGLTSEIIW